MVDTHIIAAGKQAHYSAENFVKSFELVGFENKTPLHYLISFSQTLRFRSFQDGCKCSLL